MLGTECEEEGSSRELRNVYRTNLATGLETSSTSVLFVGSQLEKQELPVLLAYFDLAGQHTGGVMHSTSVSRRLQHE